MGQASNPMPVQLLSYAPMAKSSTRVWAAAVTGMLSLGLIALGGCFLIGVMAVTVPSTIGFAGSTMPPWTMGTYVLLTLLYLMSLICFGAAGWLLFTSVRGLVRIMHAIA